MAKAELREMFKAAMAEAMAPLMERIEKLETRNVAIATPKRGKRGNKRSPKSTPKKQQTKLKAEEDGVKLTRTLVKLLEDFDLTEEEEDGPSPVDKKRPSEQEGEGEPPKKNAAHNKW